MFVNIGGAGGRGTWNGAEKAVKCRAIFSHPKQTKGHQTMVQREKDRKTEKRKKLVEIN